MYPDDHTRGFGCPTKACRVDAQGANGSSAGGMGSATFRKLRGPRLKSVCSNSTFILLSLTWDQDICESHGNAAPMWPRSHCRAGEDQALQEQRRVKQQAHVLGMVRYRA
jgi:hypothetical protein